MTHASEKKILVVEDEPDVRSFLSACIEDAGFIVETAKDGTEALEIIEQFAPDLMTLDMVMPRTSGINVIRALRQNPRWTNLPIIVITAHAHDDLGSEDIKGFNAFTSGLRPRYTMEKPVTPAKLVKAISDILQVEIETADPCAPSERCNDIIRMIRQSDDQTLDKIRNILKRG
ncbi:MAG: response regulator [Desulfobacteraceae bacterium]|nr:response regulator [Desulfobacteraceae bacterium]